MQNMKKWGLSAVAIASLVGSPARALLERAAQADQTATTQTQGQSSQDQIQLSPEGQAHLQAVIDELKATYGEQALQGNAVLVTAAGAKLVKQVRP